MVIDFLARRRAAVPRNVDQLNSVRNGALWKQRVECCQVREHADSKQVVAGELQRRKRPISGTVEYD